MLTSLDFLGIGLTYPPPAERERLDMYRHNKSLWDNEHALVYAEAFKRIERVIGNFGDVVSYPVIVNYQKLITLKTADLLVGEAPEITAGEADSAEQKTVDQIIKNTDLLNKCYETALDLPRFGDGIFNLYKDDEMQYGMIDVSQPSIWYLVVDPTNIKKTKYHVLCWVVGETGDINANPQLYVRIHSKGSYEKRVYALERSLGSNKNPFPLAGVSVPYKGNYTIKSVISQGEIVETGLNDFAIIQVPNILTSERVYGIDDYGDIDSVVSELLVRLSQIATILDKHAAPSVSGPTTALEQDPVSKEWRLKMGNYFPRDGKDDAEVKYITWDGQLDAAFKHVENLVNFLHAVSEMGGQLLGDTNQEGGALSGTALRFKMISPLAKVKRITMRFKPALEKAIVLCSQLGGEGIVDLSKTPITINFKDGLPNDPKEEADIIAVRTGNKQTMSIERVLKTYDGMTQEDADAELEAIKADEEMVNPIQGLTTPFNDPNKGGGAE